MRHLTLSAALRRFLRPALTRRLLPAGLLALGLADRAPAQTFTVTVTTGNDTGPGSLRQAITAANVIGTAATINFAIPGGGTIHLGSDLPILTDPGGVAIDGANTAGGGGPIVIDGGATDKTTGFRAFFVG